MKFRVEMIVEVNDLVDGLPTGDFEVESHITDALVEYTGNDVEFYAVESIEAEELP